MKIDWIRVLGLTGLASLATLFAYILIRTNFVFLVTPSKPTGQTVGATLYSYRLLDMVALAFVLFVSVAGCVALLMPKESEK